MRVTPSADLPLLMIDKTADMKTHQWVYQLMRHNLLCGRIEPGVALTIRGLAERIGVSPMPIREALRRLASENAIEVKDNRRVVVSAMNAEKFNELCDLRIMLETHAAAGALPRVTNTDIGGLERLDEKINLAVKCGDVDQISLCNQAFHRSLYRINPFQITLPFIESLWLQLGPFSRIAINKLERIYLVDHHTEALEALRQRNLPELSRAIEADIRDGIASINAIKGIHDYFNGVAK